MRAPISVKIVTFAGSCATVPSLVASTQPAPTYSSHRRRPLTCEKSDATLIIPCDRITRAHCAYTGAASHIRRPSQSCPAAAGRCPLDLRSSWETKCHGRWQRAASMSRRWAWRSQSRLPTTWHLQTGTCHQAVYHLQQAHCPACACILHRPKRHTICSAMVHTDAICTTPQCAAENQRHQKRNHAYTVHQQQQWIL